MNTNTSGSKVSAASVARASGAFHGEWLNEQLQERARARDIEHCRQNRRAQCSHPIRILRLPQVIEMTGLGRSKLYELQAEGSFPMRVKIASRSVGWVEAEVQAWLAGRIEESGVAKA